MNLWETILLFFSFQAILLGILFGLRKGTDAYSNRLLACFLGCMGYIIFFNVLYWSKLLYTPSFIHLNHTYLVPQSLLAPIFFFYVRSVVDKRKINLFKDFWHMVPASIILFGCSYYFIQSAEVKLSIQKQKNLSDYVFLFGPIGSILSIFMVLYIGYIFKYFPQKVKNDLDLKIWIHAISWSFLGCVFSYLLYYGLVYLGILEVSHDYAITFMMAICVLLIAYFAFNQPEVFNGRPINTIIPVLKYERTSLPKSKAIPAKNQLLEYMDTEKPYLKSDLRLDDLAKKLNLPRHHVSQIINENFEQNFNEFVNKYRVNQAVELLQQENNPYNMKEISYQVGFNNYVTFYKAFKKNTGTVPKTFKNSIKNH